MNFIQTLAYDENKSLIDLLGEVFTLLWKLIVFIVDDILFIDHGAARLSIWIALTVVTFWACSILCAFTGGDQNAQSKIWVFIAGPVILIGIIANI